ncbi:MAG: hypothetical protein V1792_08050, partial [Pseudomonadota bacterium]
LLSVAALRARELDIAGIVLSSLDEDSGPEEQFTRRDIERLVGDVPVTILPHLGPDITADPQRIADAMVRAFGADLMRRWVGLETQP